MDTYTIYEFYSFVQNISIVFSVGFAITLFFCALAFFDCYDYKSGKKELIFSIAVAILFVGCLACSIFMNYLQVR